jgi:hypothetical protein
MPTVEHNWFNPMPGGENGSAEDPLHRARPVWYHMLVAGGPLALFLVPSVAGCMIVN